jgi:hypothetical protein
LICRPYPAALWALAAAASASAFLCLDCLGVGIMLSNLGNGFFLIGIDPDAAIDPETGALHPWAWEIV